MPSRTRDAQSAIWIRTDLARMLSGIMLRGCLLTQQLLPELLRNILELIGFSLKLCFAILRHQSQCSSWPLLDRRSHYIVKKRSGPPKPAQAAPLLDVVPR